jgi:glycosyltransferase involved in cell wall biosynthesis
VLRFAWDRAVAGRRVQAAVREWRPSIIHANGVRAGLLLPAAVRRLGRLVLHDRDLRVPALAVRCLARRMDQVIAISACVAAKWRRQAAGVPLQVIPNGFDIEAMAGTEPACFGEAPPGALRVVLVADLVPWKRHEAFLEALALVRNAGMPLAGLLVGRARSPGETAYLKRLERTAAGLGLAPSVRLVTDASRALPWIAAADVLVSTATDEPFGRTVIEALALGKPVVAVDACGPGEILAGCPAATLTGPEPQAIATGLRQWLDPDRRAAAHGPALAWARRYDRQRMVEAVCALYDRLAPRPPAQEASASGRPQP